MRLIDADLLFQKIGDVKPKNKTHYEAIGKFMSMITNSPTVEAQWIPCSERLPKAKYGESENVLASCESGYIRFLYFNGGNWCYPTGEVYENRFDFVLAWMPLPEPYREDGEA